MPQHRFARHVRSHAARTSGRAIAIPVLGLLLVAATPPLAGEPALPAALLAAPPAAPPADSGSLSAWRANTFKFSGQIEAALSVDDRADDELTAVWTSRKQQHGRSCICLQRFTREGIAIGGEIAAPLWTAGAAIAPAISTAAGATWVAWQAHGQDGQGASIIARVFERSADAASGPSMRGSSEVLVNQEWLGDQTAPIIAAGEDGSALLIWVSRTPGTPATHLAARLFDRSGEPLGDEFEITHSAASPSGASSATVPAACRLADGSFAVAFAATDALQRPARIMLQRINRCGGLSGTPIIVSEHPENQPIEPAIAANGSGLLIAWIERRGSAGTERLVARRISADGAPAGSAFEVDPGQPGAQTAAAVAGRLGGGGAPDGRFAIAWNQLAPNADPSADSAAPHPHVRAVWIDSSGRPSGASFPLTGDEKGTHAMTQATGVNRLAVLGDGSLACAWSGDSGHGDSSAANISLLSAAPLDLHGAHQGIVNDANPSAPAAAAQFALNAPAPPIDSLQSPEPHVPPTFDPRQVDKGEREFQYGIADIGFTAILNTGWTPPDPSLGVGPNHLVVMTNGAIAWLTKAGVLQFQTDINGAAGFWGTLGVSGFMFDPEVLYDDTTGRFFAMCSEGQAAPNGTKSFVLLAVSDDSDPNGTWYKYRFETTALAGPVFDSPNMGVDATVVCITGDGSSGNYPVYTFDKASLLAGLPPAITRSATMPTSTQSAGLPAVSYGSPPAIYLLEHDESAPVNSVRMIALTDPLGTPTFTAITLTVPSYTAPEDPPQSGTTIRPETFDARFWSVAFRDGSLWACHHQGSSRVLARWYEFATNGWPGSGQNPALVQSGTIDPGGTIRTFFPAITVDTRHNATIVFARSSPSEFISMYTAHRDHADPPGTFQAPVQRKINTAAYTSARWGDYAGIGVDPGDGRTIWAHHEYAVGSSWRTWIAGFTPPQSCPADIAVPHDGQVNIDDLLTVINNWDAVGANPGDITGDGLVNIDDLLAVINAWGACP